MRIDITRTVTASALRSLLEGVEDGTVLEFVKQRKRDVVNKCYCGCGGDTKGRFVAGHDSKFKSLALRAARGLAPMPESFIHDDARDYFMAIHDAELVRLDGCTPEERERWTSGQPAARKAASAQQAPSEPAEPTAVPTPELKELLAEVTQSGHIG